MKNRGEAEKLNWPRWQQRLALTLLALLIGIRLITTVDHAAYRAGLLGELALAGGFQISDPNAPAGFGRMVEVMPDAPLARAGFRNGDFARTDPSFYYLLRPAVGDRLNVTLDRGGVRSEHQVLIEAVPASHVLARANSLRLVNVLAAAISILVGCFVLWRGWGNQSAMLLGAALVAIARGGSGLPAWASAPVLAIPLWWLLILSSAVAALLIPFAIRMFEQQTGALPRWHWRMASIWFGWCLVSLAAYGSDRFQMTRLMTWAGSGGYPSLLISISMLVSITYLVAGWRNSGATERSRIALIVFALAAYLFAALPNSWTAMQTGVLIGANTEPWLLFVNAVMQGLVAPGLLAYAVLRHKLFDLGFAVNRTLVYGTVSAVLLVSVGLLEYAAKSLVPKLWTQGSVFISAGIAVGLFLLFHRIHHVVEHAIERLFFRTWQVNEAALKRFVAAAAHIEKPEALGASFAAELARFTGGAAVAIYARSPDGSYASVKGKPIEADDLALAVMRAEQDAVVPAELGSPIDAAVALPMMHQAALAGFVLLGPKATGEDYRPDEIEVLGWATQQIGLDLQAIRARALELMNIRLAERNQILTELVAAHAAKA
jgi:hypothetical protein